jgi:ABC-type uncharacterized transport system substrate-binding protein
MRRREFIRLIGSAALAWPLGARAQRVGKVAKLAILGVAREAPRTKLAHEAFFAELQALGFKEGANLTSETHWIDEDTRGQLIVAAEIAQSAVDVLVVEGTESVLKAAMAANPNLPIVVYANNYDPIERGYAKTLSEPGGNITGVFTRQPELAEKQLELLTQAFPTAVRLAMLWNSESVDQFNAARRRATLLGLTVTAVELQKLPEDLDAAFREITDTRAQMLHVLSSPLFVPYRLQINQFAVANRLPAMFIFRSYVEAGGLMSYGADRIAGAKLLGSYVAKILRGAKPGDLPLDQPTKYELTVNLKTAKAIGVEIPTAILLRADEVIE